MSDNNSSIREPIVPVGRRISRPGGPGSLRFGAGIKARNTNKPVFCGSIVGHATSYVKHPNNKDASKESVRFVGEFLMIDYEGGQSRVYETYLPSVVTRSTAAMLDREGNTVSFAFDIWAEPDAPGVLPSATGYQYAAFDRIPVRADNVLMRLAVECGMVAQPTIEHDPLSVETDPETGEVIPDPVAKEGRRKAG